MGEGQKSENGSRNRDNDRSLFRYDGSPLPAAADRLNQAARGGDIDKAVIAMRLVTAAQTGALSAAIMCSTMLRITIYATLIVILTMGAASAQNNLKDIQAGENSWRTEQEKKNDEAIDRSYQSTIKTLQDAEKKKSDPWADVRPAPPAAAKNKQ